MSCNDVHRGSKITVCHGDPVIGWYCEGTGDSGHDLIGNFISRKQLQFLSSASEHEGVSAFETDDLFPCKRLVKQCPVDLLLRHPVISGPFSYIDLLRLLRDQRHDLVADKSIIDDHIRILENLQSF